MAVSSHFKSVEDFLTGIEISILENGSREDLLKIFVGYSEFVNSLVNVLESDFSRRSFRLEANSKFIKYALEKSENKERIKPRLYFLYDSVLNEFLKDFNETDLIYLRDIIYSGY